jgi:hypothetical protein
MSVADKLSALATAAAEAAAAMRSVPVAPVPPPAAESARASAARARYHPMSEAAKSQMRETRRPGSMFEHLSPEELSSQLESERSKWVQVGVEGDTIPVREGMRFRYGVARDDWQRLGHSGANYIDFVAGENPTRVGATVGSPGELGLPGVPAEGPYNVRFDNDLFRKDPAPGIQKIVWKFVVADDTAAETAAREERIRRTDPNNPDNIARRTSEEAAAAAAAEASAARVAEAEGIRQGQRDRANLAALRRGGRRRKTRRRKTRHHRRSKTSKRA